MFNQVATVTDPLSHTTAFAYDAQGRLTPNGMYQCCGCPVQFKSLAEWRGKWVVLTAAPGACPPDCQRRLYAMRQARTIQNREQDRLLRAWLVTDDTAPAPALLAEHPGLTRVRVSPAALSVLPRGGDAIYLIDPLGNQVLVWPADPDIKAMARDIGRVLKASRIG